MDAMGSLPDGVVRGLRFLRRELAPFPWRINLAMRCVLSSAIVIVTSMTLEVPALGLSLLAVFYTTQSNAVITRLAGILFMVASTVGLGIVLVLLIFTFDHPLLRIAAASLVFFASAWLMRVLKVGTMFFIVAIVVIYLQSLVDEVPVPELMVRLTLWVWVVMNYAILVTLIVNTLLLPIEPARQLNEAIHRQLGAIFTAPDPGQSAADLLTLQKLLKFAAMRDQQYHAGQAYHLALIASVARLQRAASELPAAAGIPAPPVVAALAQLRAECAALDAAVQAGRRYRLGATPPASAVPAAVDDMWRTLAALSALGAQEAAADAQEMEEEPMVAPDALTNPAYVRFAAKALLAVLIGYTFYNAVDWQGIHTMMLTCLIVALPSLGASTQKAMLRVGGALVGSALALFTVVFVIPRIDGIVGLLLTVLPVIGLGAWIAAGSERINYAGIQVMFTFSLAVLEHFGPSTNLTEIRDRMVGILLGVILAVAVQTLIWPEGEGEVLRRRLADLLRSIAAGLRSEEDAAGEGAHLTHTREQMRVWTAFATTQALLARVTLEPDWNEAENEGVIARAQAVLSSAREIIRAAEALHAQLAVQAPVPPLRAAVQALRVDVADALERYATGLEAEPPSASRPSMQSPAASGFSVHGSGPDSEPGQGVQPVVSAAQDLMRQLGGLPDWTEPMPARAAAGAPLPR